MPAFRTPMRALAVGILAVALAGCLGGAPAAEPPPTATLPALAAFAECRWAYPDGSLGPCQDEAVWLEPVPALSVDWVCVHRQDNEQGPSWRLWWHPAGGHHALEAGPQEGAVSYDAVMRLRAQDTVRLFAWRGADETLFLPFPEALADPGVPPHHEISLRFVTFALDARFEHAGDPAPVDPWWSLYEDQFWLMHHVRVDDDSYVFSGTRSTVLERHTNDEVVLERWHAPEDLALTGADFELDVAYAFLGMGRSPYPLDGVTPDRACTR